MLEEVKKQLTSVNILVMLLILAVGIYIFQTAWQVLGIFSDIIIILFSAWVISFILEPSVLHTARFLRIPRSASAALIYTAFFGLIALTIILFIPAISTQLAHFNKIIPKYVASYPQFVTKMTNTGLGYLENSLPIIPSVASFLFYVFLVLIISFYLVVDKERLQKELYNITPKKWKEHVAFTQELIESTFGSFIRVQLVFGLIAGIATWITLLIAGVNFAATTAIVAGIFTTIPFIGPVLGIIPPVAVALLADPLRGLIVFIILLLFQQILFNIIGPKLMGRAFKMHPIIVLLSFIVGYKIFGPAGAIFSVPILGIIIVIIHRLSRHFLSEMK